MAVSKYNLKFTSGGADALYVVSYRSGKFFRLEQKKFKLSDEQHRKLMVIIPQQEKEIEAVNSRYEGRVSYVKVEGKEDTYYQKYLAEYFDFYQRENGLKPRFSGAEGKALKSLIAHFNDISDDEEEAFLNFQVVFLKWEELEDFYKKQMDIRQISKNINAILISIKNANKQQTGSDFSDF